tara:strand:+ start:715 stop:2082 length:1368 start_codon:yes stop_codon:yes gene_type:complete
VADKYEAYLEYKETSIDWLPMIPVDWQVLPLKLASANKVKDGPHETPKFLDEGIPFFSVDGIQDCKLVFEGCRYISHEDHERFSMKCLPKFGDVLLGKAASVGKVAFVDTKEEFNVWSPLAVLTPKSVKLGRFIFYSLQSTWLQAQCDVNSNSNTQKNLSMGVIDNLSFAIPSDDLADKIANFLDHETAKIDTLIEKQQQLIKLLKEKRQAVISHAVTKGLNPNAPMRDSGVEWLGEVPAGWDARQLKFLCSCNDEILPETVNADYEIEYVDIGSVSSTEGIKKTERIFFENAPSRARRIARDGDVIVSTVRTYLEAIAPIESPPENLVVSTGFAVLRPNKFLEHGYSAYCLRAKGFIKEVVARSVGVSYPAINANELINIKIPVPSFEEQLKIANFLKHETENIDVLISKSENAIGLVQERRTALISAAVTGKIDVRNWVAPEPSNNNNKEVAA